MIRPESWGTRAATVMVLMWALILCACNNAVDGVTIEDEATLFKYLIKIAQQGNPEAQYHLGMMYNNGLGTSKDPKKAFESFRNAALSGDPLGAYKVGCYFDGQFKGVVAVDLTKALGYKLISANAGYALAQVDVSSSYYNQGDFDEALKWLKAAADQGDSRALYRLYVIYGEGKVVPKDYTLSYAYLKLSKLASENRFTPEAQARLDILAGGMSSTELSKAEEMISTWEPKPTAVTMKAFSGIQEAKKLVEAFESYPSSIDLDLVGVWMGGHTQKDGTKTKWKQIRSDDGSYVILSSHLDVAGKSYESQDFGRWWVEDGLFKEIVPSTSGVKQPDAYEYEFYNKECLRFNLLSQDKSKDDHEGYTFTECRSNESPPTVEMDN